MLHFYFYKRNLLFKSENKLDIAIVTFWLCLYHGQKDMVLLLSHISKKLSGHILLNWKATHMKPKQMVVSPPPNPSLPDK